ncbi:MAG: efflux RND transporter permease subunit [Clostridia bacterium]|nr:efflux RND transporter permease subunit [Clostridia bacterium]
MLSSFSVKKPLTVIIAVFLVIVLGVIAFTNLTTDLLPSMDFPYVVVYTTYAGASPEKVETALTTPLESAISTLSGIESVRSTSAENVSVIILQYAQDANMDSAIIELSSRIDMVTGQLEDAVGTPVYMKINPDMLPVACISVSAGGLHGAELTRYVEENVLRPIERVDGVASVSSMGATEEYINITLSSDKIDDLNHRILEVVNEELAKVEDELDAAQAEIDSGWDELNNQSADAEAEIRAAQIALRAARQEVNAGLAQLQLAQLETEQTLAELTERRAQLVTLILGAESLDELNAAIVLAEGAIVSIDEDIAAVTAELEALQQRRAELVAALEALPEGAEYDEERARLEREIAEVDEEIARVRAELEQQQSQRTILVEALARLVEQRDALVAALEELGNPTVDELNALLAQVNEGIAQCESGLDTIEQSRAELNAALEEIARQEAALNSGMSQLENTVEETTAALEAAEAELAAAREAFERARDEALAQANVGGAVTADMLSQLLTADNFSLPAGYVLNEDARMAVKVGEPFSSLDEVKSLELLRVEEADIGAITLEDIADIQISNNEGEVYAKLNSANGLLMIVQKQSNYSTTAVSRELRETIEDINAQQEDGEVVMLMDQGVYIDIVIGTVISNLLYGAVLAVIVLMLFLRSARSTLIVGVSIPISLMLTVVLMYFTDVNLNILSLAGLALGVGMLVDNSIVTIENIYRLRQKGMSAAAAAVAGAKQISGPIIASTLTTVCVFLPIAFTQGLTRELFADMGLTIAYSLTASLLVALTLVPALSSTLLKNKEQHKSKLHDKVSGWYAKALAWCLGRKWLPLTAASVLLAIAVGLVLSMGTEFIPDSDFSEIMVSIETSEDTTQEAGREAVTTLMDRLLENEAIETVGAMEGSGSSLSMSGSSGFSMYVVLKEDRDKTSMTVSQEIVDAAADLPLTVSASNVLTSLTSYLGSGIDLYVQGDDLDELARIGSDIAALISDVDGVYNVDSTLGEASDEVRITVDKNAAMEYGLTVAQVYAQVSSELSTEASASDITIEGTAYPVIVAKDEALSASYSDIMDMELTSAGGDETVLLGDIAELTVEQGYNSISRSDYVRLCQITAEVDIDHNVGRIGREIDALLAGYDMPEGYSIVEMGENKLISDMLEDLTLMILLAIVLIYAIMVAQFQSFLSPLIVMLTVPLAFTGAILMLYILGFNLSVIALIGLLVLVGVVVNNGIVFIDFTNKLRQDGMERKEALIEAGKSRLRPILMTTITTVLGLLTLLFGVGTGADILQPIAATIIGGLGYATLLTLIVVPLLYDVLCKRNPKKVDIGEPDSAN